MNSDVLSACAGAITRKCTTSLGREAFRYDWLLMNCVGDISPITRRRIAGKRNSLSGGEKHGCD